MNQLSRRYLLKAAAACSSIGSLGLSAPAIGQGLTKVTFTTSWIPEGPNLFAYVARDKGFWKKNGLDVSVARGSGSGTAAQAGCNTHSHHSGSQRIANNMHRTTQLRRIDGHRCPFEFTHHQTQGP